MKATPNHSIKFLRLVCLIGVIVFGLFTIIGTGGGSSDKNESGDSEGLNSPTTYIISGRITSDGSGLSGVDLSLSGASFISTTTDANGNYSFSELANGSYTITPSLTNYVFQPISRHITVSNADVGGLDFSVSTIISSDAVALDDETIQKLSSVSSDKSTLTFNSSTSTLEDLERGDVIAIGVTEETPSGLLRKVTSISRQGNQVIVETEQATLTDAIEKGTLSVTKTLTASDISTSSASRQVKRGVLLREEPLVRGARNAALNAGFDPDTELFNLSLDNVILYDLNGDQIVANGGISFGLSFHLKIDISYLMKLRYLTFTATPWQTAELTVSSDISRSIQEKIKIARYQMKPYIVMVDIWPVIMVPVVTLYVGLDGKVSAELSTGFTESASLTAGLEYSDKKWGAVSDFDIDFDYKPPELSASASIKAYIEPEMTLLIYGVVGPYSTLQGYLHLLADINDDPWWILSGGTAVGAGVQVEVLGHEIVDFGIPDIIDYQVELAHAEHSAMWYKDADGDGYSDGLSQVSVESPGSAYYEEPYLITISGDCNDSDSSIYPGAAEICDDGEDNDCDGDIDCNDFECLQDVACLICTDNDGDGYYAQSGCGTAVDCNDNDANIHPGAAEICDDGKDNDCDEEIDEGCTQEVLITCYRDWDEDGYGDPSITIQDTSCPWGYVTNHADCDDLDENVNPEANEVCDDGKDNDCDSFTDCSDPDCSGVPPCSSLSTEILLCSDRDGGFDIFTMDSDGSNLKNLTNSSSYEYPYSWSPDKTKIAYEADGVNGSLDIFVMDADGGSPINLTNNAYWNESCDWSPDGMKIVFVSDREHENYDIYIMNKDGSDQVKLADNPVSDCTIFVWAPKWSPDGSQIIFETYSTVNETSGIIGIMNADGSNMKVLEDYPNADDGCPAYSPNGDLIAFHSNRDGDFEIYVIGACGSACGFSPVQLTNNSSNDYTPIWSPDGTKIAFTSDRDGNKDMYIMNKDGSGQQNLTNDSSHFYRPTDW
jgi:Tol biopolymer transport system component